ncbi:MAG: class I SAM-dependent methyltransferase [Deltaproteobacteria bacterium]|nr:class I SAM-dependent methyltransferase [Deltaproteobacteria bacterium]
MNHSDANRFQDFFEENKYTLLKNYLYNYRLRKMAVEKSLQYENIKLILEVGSGISPVMTRTNLIIYSDLSFTALQILKHAYGNGNGLYVVADCMNLPFKSEAFSHTISSEVLEHLKDDRKALNELARVMSPTGRLVVTFPHKKSYFANDDRFVNHFRRYELSEIKDRLTDAGFRPINIHKVLGPLEKITMCFVVYCFSLIQKIRSKKITQTNTSGLMNIWSQFFKWANQFYMLLVWLDARITPRFLAAVLLIKAEKK